ncbi:Endoribonuclease L-PSP/chorismate mutase-like protein [Rhizodiscina lignyota]|uniref:Endoribonuclease L-PSP/chorismate mutase-like protein n=1 Tax=Rhizodiscina lignyota TaxID=1504668 RepID=A0A9P4M7Z7_9PEZI|nr:Endoribonuclease L-PSP/chorismate mutase-like protein [Rhizodiscina lignyota]
MANLEYVNAPGAGEFMSSNFPYSQCVKLPNGIVKLAGQGGWDTQTAALEANGDADKFQVDLAFQNIENQLKAAGLKGWEDVYLVRSYHVDMAGSFDATVANLRKWCNHKPLWTCISVPRLALPQMRIEIDIEAWDSSKSS